MCPPDQSDFELRELEMGLVGDSWFRRGSPAVPAWPQEGRFELWRVPDLFRQPG